MGHSRGVARKGSTSGNTNKVKTRAKAAPTATARRPTRRKEAVDFWRNLTAILISDQTALGDLEPFPPPKYAGYAPGGMARGP